jgi:hypothetical protein
LRKHSRNAGEIGRIQSRKREDFTKTAPAFSVICTKRELKRMG